MKHIMKIGTAIVVGAAIIACGCGWSWSDTKALVKGTLGVAAGTQSGYAGQQARSQAIGQTIKSTERR